MTPMESKLEQARFRQYLIEHWGAYVSAADYRDVTIVAEDAMQLGGSIARAAGKVLGLPVWATVEQVAALSDAQKTALREGIHFKTIHGDYI